MKTNTNNKWRVGVFLFSALIFISLHGNAQAVVSLPAGIGLNCGQGNTTDSFRVMNYNDAAKQLNLQYKCFPTIGGGTPIGPGFSSTAGSIAFNPKDQNIYYIATTNGSNSFVYHWKPDSCWAKTSTLKWSNYYSNQFVVGLDFTSIGDGYQLEFTGAAAPYSPFLRKVNFGTNSFGFSDTIILSGSKKIYQTNGDIIMTPLGDLYIAFDNKLFKIDYSTYGSSSHKVNATFIDTLKFNAAGDYLTGIAYAHGKFVGSIQKNGTSNCYFKSIDISTGAAVLSNATLPNNNYTATDMATIIVGVGAAKKVFSVSVTGLNTYAVNYDIKIRNYGNANLNNVQLVDSVKKVFGSSFSSATVVAVGTLPSGITLNTLYNGNTDCNIFVGGAGSTMSASPSDSATVRVTVNLNNPPMNTIFYNSAIASGKSILFAQSASDSSNNDQAMRSDLNFNGVPDDAGENVPTPVRLNDWIMLPNKLIDFNASPQDDYVRLHWTLENQESNIKVYIQKSFDGINFQTLDSMFLSEAYALKSFAWADRSVPHTSNYYRLYFVSVSGMPFYSSVVAVSLKKNMPTELMVSPNPFNQSINFAFNAKRRVKVTYRLFDFHSRLIYSAERAGQEGENRFSINNLSAIPSGAYFLQLIAGDEIINKIVVKQ